MQTSDFKVSTELVLRHEFDGWQVKEGAFRDKESVWAKQSATRNGQGISNIGLLSKCGPRSIPLNKGLGRSVIRRTPRVKSFPHVKRSNVPAEISFIQPRFADICIPASRTRESLQAGLNSL